MTKSARLFKALSRRYLTPLEAAHQCGILSLSQRVSEWRAAGHQIADKWVTTPGGSRVKAYKIIRATRWTA